MLGLSTSSLRAMMPRGQTIKMIAIALAIIVAVYLALHLHGALASGNQTGATEWTPDFSPDPIMSFGQLPQSAGRGGRATNF